MRVIYLQIYTCLIFNYNLFITQLTSIEIMSNNSRMQFINLRERKNVSNDAPLLVLPQQNKVTQAPKLVLPDTSYQPTYSVSNNRPSMRILKGKFDRNSSKDKESFPMFSENQNTISTKNTPNSFQPRTTSQNITAERIQPKSQFNEIGNRPMNQTQNFNDTKTKMFRPPLPPTSTQQSGFKLVLPDQEPADNLKEKQKKLTSFIQINPSQSKQGFAKKILIENQTKQKKKILIKQPQKIQPPPVSKIEVKIQQKKQRSEDKPIKDLKEQKKGDEFKEQILQNENQLVDCPEGCGRKFNRKALETHAKACKIVFMSKRKQFNSQAKRVTSKEQANLVKQAKQKQKKDMGSTKMEKTGQAWKTQSEGFRAVIKALKQQQVKPQQEESKPVTCQYCEKIFTDVIFQKHIQICQVKKEKERQKQKEKQKKTKKNTKK